MKKNSMTPSKLRYILMAAFILIVAVNCNVFYLAYRRLNVIAVDVGAKVAEANDSQDTLQELQKLKNDLEENRDVIAKTSRIAADSQNFNYQDQIISDLTTYATRSGMTITNITFSSPAAGGSLAAPAATPAPTPSTEPTPAGLKSTTVTVSLKTPTDYKNLLNFLHYIEQNLTKMKIASVTLTKSEDGQVNTDVLSLEIYLR